MDPIQILPDGEKVSIGSTGVVVWITTHHNQWWTLHVEDQDIAEPITVEIVGVEKYPSHSDLFYHGGTVQLSEKHQNGTDSIQHNCRYGYWAIAVYTSDGTILWGSEELWRSFFEALYREVLMS